MWSLLISNKKPQKKPEPYQPTFVAPKCNDPEWPYKDDNAWKSYRRYVVNKWLQNPAIKPLNNTIKKLNPNWGLTEKPLIQPNLKYVTSWIKLTNNQQTKADVFRTLFPKASNELAAIYRFPEEDRKPEPDHGEYPIY
jgi:hypothetical protein